MRMYLLAPDTAHVRGFVAFIQVGVPAYCCFAHVEVPLRRMVRVPATRSS